MKMTYNEAFRLFQGLNQVGDLKGNLKFAVAVARNKTKLREELEVVEEKSKPDNDFIEAFKDMTGAEISGIKEAGKDKTKIALIETREKQIEEYKDFLEGEFSINLKRIEESCFPQDLTANQIELIEPIIKWA